MLNRVCDVVTVSHSPSPQITDSIFAVLRTEKAPQTTVFAVSHHQCQLSVSGALRIYRAVNRQKVVPTNRVLVTDPAGSITTFCFPFDDKIHIYPQLLSSDINLLIQNQNRRGHCPPRSLAP